jgi:hypothetical protein
MSLYFTPEFTMYNQFTTQYIVHGTCQNWFYPLDLPIGFTPQQSYVICKLNDSFHHIYFTKQVIMYTSQLSWSYTTSHHSLSCTLYSQVHNRVNFFMHTSLHNWPGKIHNTEFIVNISHCSSVHHVQYIHNNMVVIVNNSHSRDLDKWILPLCSCFTIEIRIYVHITHAGNTMDFSAYRTRLTLLMEVSLEAAVLL